MKITDVEAALISIPLSRPAKMTVRTWNTRDYLVVRVHTDEGITGCGYTLANSAVLGAVKDILSPLVVGGITEWMRVAALASAYDLPVHSHSIVEVHCHTMAAIPNGPIAEYFPPEVGFMLFDQVQQEPPVPQNGYLIPPDRPGLGMELDEKALQRFRVA